jgi:hypothetical protein
MVSINHWLSTSNLESNERHLWTINKRTDAVTWKCRKNYNHKMESSRLHHVFDKMRKDLSSQKLEGVDIGSLNLLKERVTSKYLAYNRAHSWLYKMIFGWGREQSYQKLLQTIDQRAVECAREIEKNHNKGLTDDEILAIDLTPLSKGEVESLLKKPYVFVDKLNKQTVVKNINKIPLTSYKDLTEEQVQTLAINKLNLTQLSHIKANYFSNAQLFSFDLSRFSNEEFEQLEPTYGFMAFIRLLDFNTVVNHAAKLPGWSYCLLLTPQNIEKIDVNKVHYDSIVNPMNSLFFQVNKLNINFIKSVLSLTPAKSDGSDEPNINAEKSSLIVSHAEDDDENIGDKKNIIKFPYIFHLNKELIDQLDFNSLTFEQLLSICFASISEDQISTMDLTRFSRKEIYILFEDSIYPLIKHLNPTTIAKNISKIHPSHYTALTTKQLNAIDFSTLSQKQRSEFPFYQKSQMQNFVYEPEEHPFYKNYQDWYKDWYNNQYSNFAQNNDEKLANIKSLYNTALATSKKLIEGFNEVYPNEKPGKPMYNQLRAKILNQLNEIANDPRLVFDVDPDKVTKENVNSYWKKIALYIHPDRHGDDKGAASKYRSEEAEALFKFITAARNWINPDLE